MVHSSNCAKICIDIRVENNVFFFKKKQPTCFICFFAKSCVFVFFTKKQVFVVFLRKAQEPHSKLFLLHHAISPFSELHDNNLLYLLWHSKLRIKKCTPSFFRSVVGQFTQVVRIGKHAHNKQRKATPTQTLLFHVKFM